MQIETSILALSTGVFVLQFLLVYGCNARWWGLVSKSSGWYTNTELSERWSSVVTPIGWWVPFEANAIVQHLRICLLQGICDMGADLRMGDGVSRVFVLCKPFADRCLATLVEILASSEFLSGYMGTAVRH